jgi:hypothetical protein
MLYLRLPLFLAALALKNAESWGKILFELFGLQAIILCLAVLNIAFGGLLYLELRRYQDLKAELVHEEQQLKKVRVFWQNIREEFPTHKTATEVEELLAQ